MSGFKQHWTTAFGEGLRREIPFEQCVSACGRTGLVWYRYASMRPFVTCKTCLMILYKQAGW